MADCNVRITNSSPKFIARELRKAAGNFDPWTAIRSAALWFMIGACTVAAMDYGDVWFCVGQCGEIAETKEAQSDADK